MRLGYAVGYWKQGPPPGALEAILEAERLGFESVWTAEAYGSDAFTPLAWWGSHTHNLRLGTGIAQMSARAPA
uniref:LLM class flavin-dependent oxidoreductase n=1 Tax=Mycetocola sp. TaxID=1871042 RepID=UPI0039895813